MCGGVYRGGGGALQDMAIRTSNNVLIPTHATTGNKSDLIKTDTLPITLPAI